MRSFIGQRPRLKGQKCGFIFQWASLTGNVAIFCSVPRTFIIIIIIHMYKALLSKDYKDQIR